MKLEGTLDNLIISGPKLMPYVDAGSVICPACGNSRDHWWRHFLRKLKGKPQRLIAQMHWCPGDKPPTEEIRNVFWLMTQERENRCAGIPIAHLHMHCDFCKAEWLQQTRLTS